MSHKSLLKTPNIKFFLEHSEIVVTEVCVGITKYFCLSNDCKIKSTIEKQNNI